MYEEFCVHRHLRSPSWCRTCLLLWVMVGKGEITLWRHCRIQQFKLHVIWHWPHSFIIIKMLHVYHNSGLLCFLLEIKEKLCKSSSSEALQIQEHSLQNYSSLYRSLVVLNGLWLELVRNFSVEQFILLKQKHFMGTYLSETRNLNLNLLESTRCCLLWRRILLKLPGATRTSSAG